MVPGYKSPGGSQYGCLFFFFFPERGQILLKEIDPEAIFSMKLRN